MGWGGGGGGGGWGGGGGGGSVSVSVTVRPCPSVNEGEVRRRPGCPSLAKPFRKLMVWVSSLKRQV